MIGPTRRPQEFGFTNGDSHIVVNDIVETAKAYDFKGKLLWEVSCLARGRGIDRSYTSVGEDTAPGLYKIGRVYRDYEENPNPNYSRRAIVYGWYSFDLQELENQEKKYGRVGIMIHGGGSACGWPGAWAPMQPLFPTLGCVRMRNAHLKQLLLPLVERGKVFVSVYQEG